jgi:hypothetical protein
MIKNRIYVGLIGLLLISIVDASSQNCSAFLPEILNNYPNVRDIAISPQGNELYFSVQSYKKEFSSIVRLVKVNEVWQNPEIASFSGQFTDLEPTFHPNGLALYFASNRPKIDTSTQASDYDIWVVTRPDYMTDWSEPRNLGSAINTDKNEFYPSVAANGNLYFTAEYNDSKGKEDIYLSEFQFGQYQKPQPLPIAINSEKWEFNAYVAPDELYIIFTAYGRTDDLGGGDLYISYKDKNDNWVPAENMGTAINSAKLDYCPFVDAESNILYFTSEKSAMPISFKSKNSLEKILDYFATYPNGLSRIYSIPFETATK